MSLSMIVNIYAMSCGVKVKEVGMIEAFSYLFVPIFSCFFFKEKIPLRKGVSMLLIIVGVVIFFI